MPYGLQAPGLREPALPDVAAASAGIPGMAAMFVQVMSLSALPHSTTAIDLTRTGQLVPRAMNPWRTIVGDSIESGLFACYV